jgi:hypothetical protein
MNKYDDTKFGTRLLPGVDLTLWLRLVVFAILAAVAVAVTVSLG